MVSFLGLFTMFIVSFVGIYSGTLYPVYMIVLFLVNSRLSALLTGIVTRLSYMKASILHLKQSMEALYDQESMSETLDGVNYAG